MQIIFIRLLRRKLSTFLAFISSILNIFHQTSPFLHFIIETWTTVCKHEIFIQWSIIMFFPQWVTGLTLGDWNFGQDVSMIYILRGFNFTKIPFFFFKFGQLFIISCSFPSKIKPREGTQLSTSPPPSPPSVLGWDYVQAFFISDSFRWKRSDGKEDARGVGGGAANNFHVIAPPTLLRRGGDEERSEGATE